MRNLLIEKLGGHFSSIYNNLKYEQFNCGFNKMIKLNHYFCSYLSNLGVVCIISIPKDSLSLRRKSGIDGYSNIIKVCCKSNLKNFYIKKEYVTIHFPEEEKHVGGVENIYVIININVNRYNKSILGAKFKLVDDFLDENNILFLRKFIFQCIKNPNPNIAKYIF